MYKILVSGHEDDGKGHEDDGKGHEEDGGYLTNSIR